MPCLASARGHWRSPRVPSCQCVARWCSRCRRKPWRPLQRSPCRRTKSNTRTVESDAERHSQRRLGHRQLSVEAAGASCWLIDLDLATLFLRYRIRGLRQCDLENAVLELRYVLRVDLVGKRERALERTVGALHAVQGASVLLLLLIVLRPLLTPDGQLIIH